MTTDRIGPEARSAVSGPRDLSPAERPPELRIGSVPVATALSVAGWSGFAVYLVLQALAGPALRWTDSLSYAKVAASPLWSTAFWDGSRPPGLPLVLKVVGAADSLLAAQAVVAALAWGVLAWTVGCLVDRGWRRTVAVWALLAFAATFPVTLWNRSVLSESLSLSALALVVASCIWTARRLTWPRVAFTVGACAAFAALRDAQLSTVGMLGLLAGASALGLVGHDRTAARRAAALAGCLVVVAGLSEVGVLSSHRTDSDVADVFYVRVFPFPARVAWFSAHGMPQAKEIDDLSIVTLRQGRAAKVVAAPDGKEFAGLRRWLDTRGEATYARWLVTHPWTAVADPLRRPELAFNFADGDLSFYASTQDPMRSPLTPVLWPPALELTLGAVLGLYLGVLSGAWRSRPWRVVVALGAVGALAMLVAWQGDGQEVTRHTVEGFAQLRVCIWILVVVGVLGRERRPAELPADARGRRRAGLDRAAAPTSDATAAAGR